MTIGILFFIFLAVFIIAAIAGIINMIVPPAPKAK
jgi:hypothetical protein